jgi:hypothetical protein
MASEQIAEDEKIGNMTKAELEAFVLRVTAGRLRRYPYRQHSDRPVEEVLKSMRKNIIKRKPGDPSTLEMLREDRDR